jgi:hypothetical protein
MKVKPFEFLTATIFSILTISVVVTREPVSWWLTAIMAFDIAIVSLRQSLEDS